VVSEVVRLVDDDQVVVAPVDAIKRRPKRLSTRAAQISVTEKIVGKSVCGEDVGAQVSIVIQPVVRQLLRTKHQDRLVAQLVVLDDRKCSERLAKAYAIRQD